MHIRKLLFVITIVSLVLTASYLINFVAPSEEAIIVRNSLLATYGDISDYKWKPSETPASFLKEEAETPEEFNIISDSIIQDSKGASNFEKSLILTRHLLKKSKGAGPIISDSLTSYRKITEEGLGYCSDYIQVFIALAISANIPVREWGLSFESFGRGHAFVEIYDYVFSKWMFIDVFNSFYIIDRKTKIPLSVLEFRDWLNEAENQPEIEIIKILPEKFPFDNQKAALDYYRRGKTQFYMWWGNNIFSYEAHPVVRFFAPVSRSLEQAAAILIGVHPRIYIDRNEKNEIHIRALEKKLYIFIGLIVVFGVLCVAALYQISLYKKHSGLR